MYRGVDCNKRCRKFQPFLRATEYGRRLAGLLVPARCGHASKEDGADWDGGVGDSAAECGEGGW